MTGAACVDPFTLSRMRLSASTGSIANGSKSWPDITEYGDWHRTFEASDILGMQRTPNRRPFDHPNRRPDGHGGTSKMQKASSLSLLEPDRVDGLTVPLCLKDCRRYADDASGSASPARSGCESPAQRSTREQASTFWKEGTRTSMRIIQSVPAQYHKIWPHTQVYQGSWSSVDHIKAVRGKCPANRSSLEPVSFAYPQGVAQEDINRNRNFAPSHGTGQIALGFLRIGSQVTVP
jgi:hypothetical protein